MPGVTKEQIQAAREADLFAYLQFHEPGVLKRDGPNYRHKEHDSLVYVTGKRYWYWNSRGRSINALDCASDECRPFHGPALDQRRRAAMRNGQAAHADLRDRAGDRRQDCRRAAAGRREESINGTSHNERGRASADLLRP